MEHYFYSIKISRVLFKRNTKYHILFLLKLQYLIKNYIINKQHNLMYIYRNSRNIRSHSSISHFYDDGRQDDEISYNSYNQTSSCTSGGEK